ncbi:MAG: hypothetical protein ABIH21_00380 [Patescibacteria group bacterium]
MKPKKTQQNYHLQKSSVTARVLLEMAQAMDDFLLIGYHPTLALAWTKEGAREILNEKEARAQRQAVARLKKRRLLTVKKQANEYHIKLTKQGQAEAFRLKILNADLLPRHQICMVVFDIPETQRKLRQQLRLFLKTAAFIPIQRSVWITPFDVCSQLQKLFSINNVKGWVKIFRAVEYRVSNLSRSGQI